MSSIEEAFLIKVIENRDESAAEILHEGFLDGELVELHEQLGRALKIVNDEIGERGGNSRPSRPSDWSSVADTGAINIVRGTE